MTKEAIAKTVEGGDLTEGEMMEVMDEIMERKGRPPPRLPLS